MFENLLKRSEYHLIYLSTVYILSACLRPALSFPGSPQMKMKSLMAAAPGHHRGRMVGCSSTQPLSTGSYTSSDWKVGEYVAIVNYGYETYSFFLGNRQYCISNRINLSSAHGFPYQMIRNPFHEHKKYLNLINFINSRYQY